MPGSAEFKGKPGHGLGKKDWRPNLICAGEGPMPAKVMLIGERPGETEAKTGRPFVGLAGQYLDLFLDRFHIDRDQLYVTNLVKEFGEYEKPTEHEINQWWPVLVDEIALVQPTIIGLLGTYAVEAVLGVERAHLERTHGVPVRSVAAGVHECIVLPMFHPAAGIYKMDSMTMVMTDVEALAKVMAGDLLPLEDYWNGQENYSTISGRGAIVRGNVAIDTEGSVAKPWCLTYSGRPGRSFLQRPGNVAQFESEIVWVHNSMHDLGVLRKLGCPLGERQFRDTMVYAYLLAIEPQGLKDLAWRHCGMQMDSYDDIIGDAQRDIAIAYLEGVNACEWKKTEPYVIIEGGKARIKKPHSINQRVSAILGDIAVGKRNKKGDPVDPVKRWNDIEDYIKTEVVEELGEMPEASLDDVDAAKAERYACRDSDATIRVAPILEAKIDQMGLRRAVEIDHDVLPAFDRMQHVGIQLAPKQFWDDLEAKCDNAMGVEVKKIYDSTGADINPDSPKQTAELLFNSLGLTVKKWTKGGKNGKGPQLKSTSDKALEAIYREHPVVDNILNYREASKIKNSYVKPLRRSAVTGDGRVHCTFRLTRVVTGRPSATKPNLLAIPVRSQAGKEIRGGFVAPPGRVIGDWDMDQVEMRYMADESGDEALCKLFVDGDKDVHTDTAAKMFGVDYHLVKKEQRYAAKRVGFGVITGITEFGLADQMALARAEKVGGGKWTEDDCAKMIAEYFKIYPMVKVFFVTAGNELEMTGMVRDKWGRIRYLPGIWSPIRAVREEARRQASSFKIQSGAAGYMKIGMKAVWDHVIRKWANQCGCGYEDQWPVEPLLQIYDSMVFEMEEWVADEAGKEIVWHLTNTIPVKQIPFTAKGGYGPTWLTT